MTAALGIAIGHLRTPGRRPIQDPPEPWEQELSRGALSRLGRGPTGRHPYRPLREADVPSSAVTALAVTCGAAELRRLLVIPASVRPISAGRRWRWVSTPTQVLGLGTRGVGLWVARSDDDATAAASSEGPGGPRPALDGLDGEVREVIALADLALVEDARILLSGRLTFAARERSLRVRYSTVARYDLRPALDDVRSSLAGDALPLADLPAVPPLPLPLKWQILASTPTIRLGNCDATILYDEPATGRRRPRPTLVAITPYELIIAREPSRNLSTDGYGVDAVHLARRRIERVEPVGGSLAIRARDVDLVVDIGERLVADARRAFAGQLPWR